MQIQASTTRAATTRVLFVCLGNICRSPLAEGVFRHLATTRGVDGSFTVDSAGTSGYHAGECPDPRMLAVAAEHDVALEGPSRRVVKADFERFDHLVCMDADNREALLAMGAPAARVRLLLTALPGGEEHDVPDPYYGGDDGFHEVYRLVFIACAALLDELLAGRGARSP